MVELVAVRVDGGDRDGDSLGFRSNPLNRPTECGVEVCLAEAEIRSCQIGKGQTYIVHLGDRHEEIPKRRRRNDPQVTIPDRDRHRVFQIRREFVEKKNERVTAEQLLPGLGARRAEQWRNVAGELFGFTELIRDRTPDSAYRIGASSIEAGHATAAELRCGILLATEDCLSQLGITRQ